MKSLENIVDACNWYKSYKYELTQPNSEEFTKGYLKQGCDKCEGVRYQKKCYYAVGIYDLYVKYEKNN